MNTALSTVASAPGWSAALTPQNTDEAWKIATAIAKSSLVPKQYQGQPGDIIIAASMGARLGLDPFSAMQGIAVVNGRPTLWGDAMLAVCQSRPDWRGQTVKWTGEGEKLGCTVTVRRQVGPAVDEYAGQFNVDDAKKAGLWTKQGPWSQYPRRMLELRARAFALRGSFADALLGFHAKEEMDDAPLIEVTGTVHEEAPRGRKAKTVAVTVTPDVVEHQPAGSPQSRTVDAAPADSAPAPEAAPDGERVEPPTLDQVRAAVNRAASAVGGARKIIEAIEKYAGYSVVKADEIKPEHRAEAIRIADEFAGIKG